MAKKRRKTKKSIKKDNFTTVINILFLILSCILVFLVFSLKILPNKYFYPIVIVLLILNIALFLLLHFKKNIFIKFISVLGCVGLFYCIVSLSSIKGLLNSMNVKYKTSNYAVIVLKNSNYQKIDDLNNKKLGFLTSEEDVISKHIKINYDKKNDDDVVTVANDLLNKKVDGIILEKTYIDMLSEDDSPIPNFDKKVKIIDEFTVDVKQKEIVKDIDITHNTFALYISGIDTYGKVASVSRTDVNMVVVINPDIKQILMVSIPRDYYVTLADKKAKDKLTHSGIYGIETSVKTVEDLLDININYYYKINFTSLIKIVDTLGGVDAYSNYTFTSKDGYNYKKGYNHMDGKQALSFVRERKAFSGGDRVRNENQQALMEALFRKCTSPSIIVKYNNLLNSLKGSFITNMPSNRLTSLIKMQLDDNAKWNITSYRLDGTNARKYTYTYKSNSLYVMIPNQDTINKAKALIKQVYSNQKLASSYSNSTVTKTNQVTKNATTKKNITSNKSTSNAQTSNKVVEEQVKEYVITFITNDEKTIIKVKEGEKVPKPENPLQMGYEFIGWYDGNNLYNFDNLVTKDLVLVAKYQELVYDNENDITEE